MRERFKRETEEAETAAQTKKKPTKTPLKAIGDIPKERPNKKREATSADAPESKRILAITDYAKMTPAEQALHEKQPLLVVKLRRITGKQKRGNGANDPVVAFHDSKDDPYIVRPKLQQQILN